MFKYVSYCDSIMLYWELPENYEKGDVYSVLLNGKEVGSTEKCHFCVENLDSETEYKLSAVMKKTNGQTEKIGDTVCKTEAVKNVLDITKSPYFAVGDGKTVNTAALQKALDDCKCGERVYVPAGDYMTGSLFMHSDTELYLEEGAIIHGTASYTDYEPKIKSRFEGYEMMTYAGLINIGELDRGKGINCKNVRICGKGTVCGGGIELAQNVIDRETLLLKEYIESLGDKAKEFENPSTIAGRLRPRLINVSCAENVLISGIKIENGASWNVHMIYSENIVTHSCTFKSEKVWNGDGWDPDSSSNCTLFGCEFFTGDDAVAIKSGKNPEGNIINIPCEHICVFDCISHYGHGITIGSEMSGGVNDVRIWNCDMKNSVYGVEIKATKKRGGYVRNVRVRYCDVCRVLMHSVPYNDDGEAAPEIPVFENCKFENMTITAVKQKKYDNNDRCSPIELYGFNVPGHFIKNVKFKDIVIDDGENSVKQAIYLQCCEGITLENIYCR